ncbi:ATP-binding protein [Gemmiger formicilis]|uniref:hybrid sensor histidine kinase/response regulator n=1 Tax=Gemmiger formicilis TaxID=745368 RepID=UPI002109B1FF|nr:ATP-binding protein [Gemmiger formicilis]MCQ5079745.1 ATP-binding protein [Gemmiger formicilis]MCQ5115653.1 ATP-binding protein [Gemmiger formicilis]
MSTSYLDKNVHRRLELESDILNALCASYRALYRVNLDTDTAEPYAISAKMRPEVALLMEPRLPYSLAIERYITRFVQPTDQNRLRVQTSAVAILARLADEDSFTLRYRVQPNPSKQQYFNLYVARTGTPHVVVIGFRNIDRLLKSVEKGQHELEQTLAAARIGLFRLEFEENCPPRLFANDTMCGLLGIEPDTLTPEQAFAYWQSRVDPAYLDTAQAGVDAILKTGIGEVNYPWNHPKLGVIYIRCGGVPDQNFDRPGSAVKGYHQDITDTVITRKKQEEELAQVNVQLQRAVEDANRAMAAKSEFLSRMSHDIRTPINAILGMLDIAEKYHEDYARLDDCAHKIRSAANHLLSLVNDVLDMNRLENGQAKLVEAPADLNELVHDCVIMTQTQAERDGLTMTVDHITVEHNRVRCYALQLRQILINLLSNAVKYNRPGGNITLRADELYCNGKTVTVQYTVRDTGIGMSEEFQQHIFEPFTQENPGARTKYTGSGLGLSIVRELVERMGGTIQLESLLGEGSLFIVTLSFALDTAPAADTPAEAPAADLQGMRVLVAEDNALNMEITQFMLDELHVAYECAENGAEALCLYKNAPAGHFDAILMDMMMPVMDGTAAAAAIRALPREDAADIPIIALTANVCADVSADAAYADMDDCLFKPVQPSHLQAMLAKYYVQHS